MKCPICNNNLNQEVKNIFACPNIHGVLVTGKIIRDLQDAPDEAGKSAATEHTNTTREIQCPHCSTTMHKADYNLTGIMIDSCMNCHYRWLDYGEISKIKDFKPQFDAQDLLYLLDFEEKLKKSKNHKIEEANPRLHGDGVAWRAGGEALSSSTGDYRYRSAAIFGQGLHGLIKGLLHSRLSRIFTIVTVVIFALLLWYAYYEFTTM